MKIRVTMLCLAAGLVGLLMPAQTAPAVAASTSLVELAQAMIPPTGMDDSAMAEKNMAATERMLRRFPQPVRVGDLIGLPLLDENSRTIGYVGKVVRTPANKIELVINYDGWFGWGTRPVAVPIEVVGIQGRELASLDMPRGEYKTAPTWQPADATAIPDDDSIRIALSRR
jgi:PRC-barrel domain